jgi:hypothetical protein
MRYSLLVLLAGCGAATMTPSQPLPLVVGTGEPGVLRPLAGGEPLLLQRGCQGSQHVFTSVQAPSSNGAEARVQVRIVREMDGQVVSSPLDIRVPFEADRRITGLTPVVEEPRQILELSATVEVVLTDGAGGWSEGSMTGVVRWGLDACRPH